MADWVSKNQLFDLINALTVDGEFSQDDAKHLIAYLQTQGQTEGSPRDMMQVYRGLKKDLPNLVQGEIGYCFDTKELFIGGINGNDNLTQSKLFIDVKSFGAVGDGVNDDAPAIRQAIEHIKNHGDGTLYFPTGNYLLRTMTEQASQKLFAVLPSNIKIMGDGKNRSIIKAWGDGAQTGFQTIFGSLELTTLVENVEISALSFDMNGQNNLQIQNQEYFNGSIILRKASNVTVKDCSFENCAGMQVVAIGYDSNDDANNVNIFNNDFKNVSDSIAGNFSSDHSSIYVVGDDVFIRNNRFSNDNQSVRATAIESDGKNHIITGNYCSKYSIFVLSAAHINYKTDNQIISDNIGVDILTGVMIYNTVDGNYRNVKINNNIFELIDGLFVNVGRSGINALDNVSAPIENVDITNNQIYTRVNYALESNGYQSGIQIRTAKNLKISGNAIFNLGGNGIYVISLTDKETSHVNILNNHIYDIGQKHASGYKTAISLQSLFGITDLSVSSNRIENVKSTVEVSGIEMLGKITGEVYENVCEKITNELVTTGLTFATSRVLLTHTTYKDINYRDVVCHKGSKITVLANGATYGDKVYTRKIDGSFNVEMYGVSIPSSGSWLKGDIVYNTDKFIQGDEGSQYIVEHFECIADGSVGQWVTVKGFI